MHLLQRTAAEAGDALPCVLLAAKDDLGMSPVSHHTVPQPFIPCLSQVLARSDVDTLWETEPGHVSIIWILASFPGRDFRQIFNPSVLSVRLKVHFGRSPVICPGRQVTFLWPHPFGHVKASVLLGVLSLSWQLVFWKSCL